MNNKIVLITGGTGTFGQKFAETVLKEYNPEQVRIYSRGEELQRQMSVKFKDDRLRFLIGDVRDKERLKQAMTHKGEGIDYVVHAAALKQIPTCEGNPIETVRTNIEGPINLIEAAVETRVGKVIAISSDKAVQPVNLYGATKMVMEKLFMRASAYTGITKFSCVRYGNVVGSRGSVIPIFKEQAKKGVLTITDERMTRYWLTAWQAVHFTIECLQEMKGGEIFIMKCPSMRITDLARVIAPDAKWEITGIRPGEKLHESLDIGMTSDTNDWWLTKDELRGLIETPTD